MTSCAICGSKKIHDEKVANNIRRGCRACGVWYFYPFPTEGFLNSWYSEARVTRIFNSIAQAVDVNHTQNANPFRHYFDLIGGNVHSEDKVLDIGCYSGKFLYEFNKLGCECIGIDVNAGFVNYGKKEFGLDLRCGTLHSFDFPSNHFDVVTAHQVLEHLPNPKAVMHEVCRILKPGGIIQLSVPDASISTKVDFPNHIFYFGVASIRMLLRATGFIGDVTQWKKQSAIIGFARKGRA